MSLNARLLYKKQDRVMVRTPMMDKPRLATVIGFGNRQQNPDCVRVILDGGRTPYTIHLNFIQIAERYNSEQESKKCVDTSR